MCFWFDCLVVFQIAVPSRKVLYFAVLYIFTYNVIEDVLDRFGLNLVSVRRIPGGIGTLVASRVWWTWACRFVASVYVGGRVLIYSLYGCRPIYEDSISYPIHPDRHHVDSFHQYLVRT